jgi:hypothetical protein
MIQGLQAVNRFVWNKNNVVGELTRCCCVCQYGCSDLMPTDEFRQTYLWDFCYKPLWLWPTEHFVSKIALYDSREV